MCGLLKNGRSFKKDTCAKNVVIINKTDISQLESNFSYYFKKCYGSLITWNIDETLTIIQQNLSVDSPKCLCFTTNDSIHNTEKWLPDTLLSLVRSVTLHYYLFPWRAIKCLHMWLRLQNFQIRIIIIHLIFGFSSYLIRKESFFFFYNLFYTAHLTFFNRVWLKIMGCLSVFRRVDKK